MSTKHYSSLDPNTGNITWNGPLSIQKGNHGHMPPRTDTYLPGEYETGSYHRGHVNASSLGGTNTEDNVTPQHEDLNRAGGGYYNMERGERAVLQNGGTIDSLKIAIVNGNPGDRPEVFMISDKVTYPDGHTENVHLSFTNASYEEQQAWNDQLDALPDFFDPPNPGDALRNSMSSEEYAELMESTDVYFEGVYEEYLPSDFSGVPDGLSYTTSDVGVSDIGSADMGDSGDSSSGADCGMDD